MTIKELNSKLVEKQSGLYYIYIVDDMKYEIHEFNGNKGWCLNEFKLHNGDWFLKDCYGHNGLTLKACKEMILMNHDYRNLY